MSQAARAEPALERVAIGIRQLRACWRHRVRDEHAAHDLGPLGGPRRGRREIHVGIAAGQVTVRAHALEDGCDLRGPARIGVRVIERVAPQLLRGESLIAAADGVDPEVSRGRADLHGAVVVDSCGRLPEMIVFEGVERRADAHPQPRARNGRGERSRGNADRDELAAALDPEPVFRRHDQLRIEKRRMRVRDRERDARAMGEIPDLDRVIRCRSHDRRWCKVVCQHELTGDRIALQMNAVGRDRRGVVEPVRHGRSVRHDRPDVRVAETEAVTDLLGLAARQHAPERAAVTRDDPASVAVERGNRRGARPVVDDRPIPGEAGRS